MSAGQLLVVEDERNVGVTLAERLEGAGYKVTLAESAAKARLAWRARAHDSASVTR